jgi:hypothetical protein
MPTLGGERRDKAIPVMRFYRYANAQKSLNLLSFNRILQIS